jgi:hypothetical protein
MNAYQLLAMAMKSFVITTSQASMPFYEGLIINIDLILVILLIFAIGGVDYVNEHILVPGSFSNPKPSTEDTRVLTEFNKIKGFKRLLAWALVMLIQLVQWGLILLACGLSNRLIEGLVITISFIAHGLIIRNRWHSNSLVVCSLLSVALFYLAASATVPFKYTQFLPIVIGLLLLYMLYRVGYISTKRLKAMEDIHTAVEDISKTLKNGDECHGLSWKESYSDQDCTHAGAPTGRVCRE